MPQTAAVPESARAAAIATVLVDWTASGEEEAKDR